MKMTAEEYDTLKGFMYHKFGINLEGKQLLIEGRLSPMLQKRGFTDFSNYIKLLFGDKTGAEESLVVSKLTTNYTYFLREQLHYDFMTDKVLPDMIARRQPEINIWSAACSSGEEPYSIAMVARDYLTKHKSAMRVKINASDISNNVLTLARDGRYSIDMISKLPKEWVAAFFSTQSNGRYRVTDEIKSYITFRNTNLMEPRAWPKVQYDIIFCRNVMIYFDRPTKQALTSNLFDTLKPGGYLFIGTSESLVGLQASFEYVKPAIYRRPL